MFKHKTIWSWNEQGKQLEDIEFRHKQRRHFRNVSAFARFSGRDVTMAGELGLAELTSSSLPPVPGKMADLRADNRWQRACGLLAGFSFPGSLLRFGAQPLTSRKLLTTINALKEIELRKNFTMVRKSMYPSPWQNSFFIINFKRSRTG